MPDNPYTLDLQHLAPVYLALLISGGQFGLPVVILTASRCKKVTWHPTILNYCITWTIYSIIHCVYLYAENGTANRNFKLCMVQASMIYGAAPMAVVAGLAIVLHMWITLQCPQHPVFDSVPRLLYPILMLGTPYLIFFAFSIGAGIFVVSHPQSVGSNGLYCTIRLRRAALVVPSFCAVMMVMILALEAVITIQFYRQSKIIKKSFPLVTRTPSCSICFRLGLFSLHSCVTFASAILSLGDVQADVTYMLPAALPLGALIVFGLREGVVSVWTTTLGRRKHSSPSLELVFPSARVASTYDPTSTPGENSEEISQEPNAPV